MIKNRIKATSGATWSFWEFGKFAATKKKATFQIFKEFEKFVAAGKKVIFKVFAEFEKFTATRKNAKFQF